MNDMFVREDISKPENRINLAIFHLLMIDEFREWIFNKLNIDVNSTVYPVTNSGGNRPDMIIKNGEKVIGCIEVEIGNENVSQTLAYSKCYDRVFTISGLKRHNSDLSLEHVKDFINAAERSKFNSQQILSLNYLSKLIDSYIYGFDTNSRTQISEKVSGHPFFNKIIKELSDLISGDFSKIYPGQIGIDTVKDEGLSLKVYSRLSNNNKLALISRSGGRDTIIFQSALKYRKYLSNKPEAVERWIEFVDGQLNGDIKTLDENKRVSIPIDKIDNENLKIMIILIRNLV